MIGVHLRSEQVVNWCRFLNEMIGVHVLWVGISILLVCMIGVHLLSVRTSSILVHMTGVQLLSEQVVNWYRFQNEMTGVHLLSVGTSSVLV